MIELLSREDIISFWFNRTLQSSLWRHHYATFFYLIKEYDLKYDEICECFDNLRKQTVYIREFLQTHIQRPRCSKFIIQKLGEDFCKKYYENIY